MRRAAGMGAALLTALALLIPAAAQAATEPDCPAAAKAPSAIVIEVSTGTVACARNADQERQIGSTTKLMTALLVLEEAKLSDTFKASSYRPSPIESQIGLQPGERMKVSDLMRGLLLESGNDAAMTLAQGVAGSTKAFVRQMNRRAKKLGLTHTHYDNPIGLDGEGNYSTARDLVTLATVLRTNKFFKKIVDSPSGTLKTGVHPRTFRNRNSLIQKYPYVNGVKTGHTRGAGYVLVGSASRNGVQLVSAVLATPSEAARDADTMALYKWAFPRFQRIRAVIEGHPMATARIRFRAGAELKLVPDRTIRRIVLRGHRAAVKVDVEAPSVVEGPIRSGQRLGKVDVKQNGRLVATVPLIAQAAVPAAQIADKTKSAASSPLLIIGVALAVVLATVLLAARRRARMSRGRRTRQTSAA
ncbi:MAG TPA: D-alanyl-D-alanine carboxypeptidase family protein [Solirubrobacter sp.]